MENYPIKFSELLGKTIVNISGLQVGSYKVVFETDDGYIYVMFHNQECCEEVCIKDVCGNVEDLLNAPIRIAEEKEGELKTDEDGDSMFTFYTLATIKGYVDIQWLGSSNGWYSIGVSLGRLKKKENFEYYADKDYDTVVFWDEEHLNE